LTEIANIHIQSLQLSWDAYPENQATAKDLSPRKMKAFLKRVREGGRFKGEGDWQVVLEKLGYLKNGVPTHAAMILFGKNDSPYQLHIGRFKTPSTIIDDRMIRGTLFDVVEDAMKFIISHLTLKNTAVATFGSGKKSRHTRRCVSIIGRVAMGFSPA
jgi:ATP-dependent DNA helicase RecG